MPSLTRFQRIREIKDRIETGEFLADSFFDQLYSKKVRDLSSRHWTPAEIAIRIARELVPSSDSHCLDIGSGPGKFCIIGALSTPGQFTGAELRPQFTAVATELAHDFDVEKRTHFLTMDALDVDWSTYTAVYFYNPFYEHVAESRRIDNSLELGMHRLEHYVRGVQTKLRDLKKGTKVGIFHGFGGGMVRGYDLLLKEPAGSDSIEIWIKT